MLKGEHEFLGIVDPSDSLSKQRALFPSYYYFKIIIILNFNYSSNVHRLSKWFK